MTTLAARIAALQRREQQQQPPTAAPETGQQPPAPLQATAGCSQPQQQQQQPRPICQAGIDAASLLARAAVLRCRDSMVQGAAAAAAHIQQQQQHEVGVQHAPPPPAAAGAAGRPDASQAASGQLDRPEQYVEVLRSLLAAGGYDPVGDDTGNGDAYVAEMDVDDHSTFPQELHTATQPALDQSLPAAAAKAGGSGGQEGVGAGQAPAGDRLDGVSCAGAAHTMSAEQQQCWQQQQQPSAGEEQRPPVEPVAGSSNQQQQQQQSSQQSCQPGRAPTPAGTGAASILARAAVLRGRDSSDTRVLVGTAAAHTPQQQQEQLGTPAATSLDPAAGAAAASQAGPGQLDRPEQYVEALRSLLAAGGYDPVGDEIGSSSGSDSGAEDFAEMEVDGHDAAPSSHQGVVPAGSKTLLPAEPFPPAAAAAAPAAATAGGGAAGGAVGDSGPAEAAAAATAQGVDQAAGVRVLHPKQEHHQQQQQQQEEVGSGPAVPDHIRRVLLLAGRSLTAGFPAQAREQAAVALSALQQQQQQQQQEGLTTAAAAAAAAAADGLSDASGLSSSSSSSRSLQVSLREAEQLHALATVLAEAAQHNWLAALQLPHTHTHDSGSTSSSSIQRAYRRLAGLIHPDKCAHPSAASGFQALSRAHTAALQAARQAAAGGDGDGGDEGWGADDAGGGGGDDYAWWSKWEVDVSEGCIDGAAAAAGGRSRRGDSTAAAEEDEAELWAMELQELAAEVERRQGAVWAPQQGSDDAGFTPRERQQRVKAARSVLSQRLKTQRQQQVQQVQHGFFAEEPGDGVRQQWGGGAACDGMDGDEEDGCGGWGWDELPASNEFKRQRL